MWKLIKVRFITKKKNIKFLFFFVLVRKDEILYRLSWNKYWIQSKQKKVFGFVPSLQKKIFLRSFTDKKRSQNRIKTILLFPSFFFCMKYKLGIQRYSPMQWLGILTNRSTLEKKKKTRNFFIYFFKLTSCNTMLGNRMSKAPRRRTM
jgi:hypothetical protein